MKKSKNLFFNIQQPCGENWDRMSPNEKGRHCESCNKTVIDFSNYTDKELATFFKNFSGSVCGRLNSYQVNRPILITEQPNRSFLQKIFFGTAIASWLGISATAVAQDNNNQVTVGHTIAQKNKSEKKPSDSMRVEGYVHDYDTHEAVLLANVSIELDSVTIASTVTDIDGNFTMKIPVTHSYGKLLIKCTYDGYLDYTAYLDNITYQVIMLLPDKSEKIQHVIMGDINSISKPRDSNYNKPFNTPRKSTYYKDDIEHMAR
jgi:hypothetical protein